MIFLVLALALLIGFDCGFSTQALARAQKSPPEKAPTAAKGPPAAPPFKIRRTVITVVDNWTVTCTQTDLVRLIATPRIMMPKSVVRLSAERQYMTDELQAMCFLAGANSIYIGDVLLTTKESRA